MLQSGASSRAKHGGAYFSAVYGFMKGPIAAPRLYENQEDYELVAIAPAPTLFTTSTKHCGSYSNNMRMIRFVSFVHKDLFPDKYF